MAEEKQQRAKVLCVDDEPGVLQSLTRLLKKDFEVYTAASAEDGLKVLEDQADMAVIVSDYRMPGMNGIEFLKEARSMTPSAARTILSGQIDINELSEAINKAEIHRFFLKPWENDYLRLQIHEAVQTHINLSEKSHFQHLAITDPVTGLTNHRYFQDLLREKIEEQTPLALLMVDVDHFKSFNDKYGHPEGDRLLRGIASTIDNFIEQKGSVSRYGGEEFSVLLPQFEKRQAMELAEQLRLHLAENPVPGPGREAYVTVSIGGACFPEHTDTPQVLIQLADDALYKSKGLGRNCTSIAEAS
ncbi:MAG: diguanylate cyclase [Bdellovibrionales bacterium]|nr:diguanylate cyclase [Bdellovibrionales bacterium]